MTTLSRRQLLGVLGGTAGVAGGGYWLWQTVNCPETVESTHGYTNDSIDIWSEPVLNRNHTYIGEGAGVVRFSSDTRQFRLLALDGRGEPQWVIRLELQGGIGRPLVTADQVIVPTGGNTLTSCDRNTGSRQWTLDFGNNEDGHMSSVAAEHDDHILVVTNEPDDHGLSGGSYLLFVSADDGEVQWTAEVDEVSRGLALLDGQVIVATRDGTVDSFDPGTGDQRWSTDLNGAVGWRSTPQWFANRLWIAREDGVIDGLDPETGDSETQFGEPVELDDGSLREATPAVERIGDQLLIGDADGVVAAYGPTLGRQWEYDVGTRVAAIDTVDDRIGVLDQRGQYTELDPETGEFQRSFLLVVRQRDDWCGFDPSYERFRGLTAMSRQSLVVTGQLFGTQFFRLPRRSS